MAQSLRDIKHGTAHAKVAGDDEMLRTGFHNGTPLEAGKIADSEPLDLFAPARGVAEADNTNASPHHHHHQQEEEDGEQGKAVDQLAGGGGVAVVAKDGDASALGRQGVSAPTAGGRRLGRQ